MTPNREISGFRVMKLIGLANFVTVLLRVMEV